MDTACRVRLGKGRSKSPWAGLLAGLLMLGMPVPMPLHAGEGATRDISQPIRFGVLPIGGAAEAREQWRPLLLDLERRLGNPVTIVSVTSYAGLAGAINDKRVDMAFLSGQLAVDAVEHQHMSVVAQFTRADGPKGNVAMLVTRADGPIHNLKDLLAKPGHWRYARGEALSVTGYVAPEAEVFAPRGLNSDTFFASVRTGNRQNNALAVVNGEVDVASNDSADLDLFRQDFLDEASQLKVIWRSNPIPGDVLVVSDAMPELQRRELIAFIHGYGHAAGAAGEREHANLARIPGLAGFAVADNRVLQPFVELKFLLIREQVAHGQWVSEKARAARLAQVDADYQKTSRGLLRH